MAPIDVTLLGKASIQAKLPELPEETGKKIAVIGGGPAGISVAWQLRRQGHDAVVYDMSQSLGGKIVSVIPDSRIPKAVISAELERIQKVVPHIRLRQKLGKEDMDRLRQDYDFIVIAIGLEKPGTLDVPGKERMLTALDFLAMSKEGQIKPGNRVVVIGAGNVGCDVATEAYRLGAKQVTLLARSHSAAFGKEREEADALGAKFRWPCYTQEITQEGVKLTTGEVIPADTVVVAIGGDKPDLEFLPPDVVIDRGFIQVNENYQTTDPQIFAVGDVVKPGLLTDAIGAGRKAAQAITDLLQGKRPHMETRKMIDPKRIALEYFDPRVTDFEDIDHCGSQCSSCGVCRDCGICVAICPQAAISRREKEKGVFEYVVDGKKCIGCGFCTAACPCGIWDLVENEPLV